MVIFIVCTPQFSLSFLFCTLFLFPPLKKKRFYLFSERGEGREKEGETLMCETNFDWLLLAHPQLGTWPETQACALIGNRTSDPLVCRLALNPLSHTSHSSTFFILIAHINYLLKFCGTTKNIFLSI